MPAQHQLPNKALRFPFAHFKESALSLAFPSDSMVKNLPAMQQRRVWSLGGEDSWRRKWQATPVFLPGKSHGEKSLAGYSSWGLQKSQRRLSYWTTTLVLTGQQMPRMTSLFLFLSTCKSFFSLLFWLSHIQWGILVPRPGIYAPWGASLESWTTRKFPSLSFCKAPENCFLSVNPFMICSIKTIKSLKWTQLNFVLWQIYMLLR